MANKIMLYTTGQGQERFTHAKLLTRRVVRESNTSHRHHHALKLPSTARWSLQQVRGALREMVNGAEHRGGRWFWTLLAVHRVSATQFVFVTRDQMDI